MVTVNLFSEKSGEVNKFLSQLYNTNLNIEEQKSWEKNYANPVEVADIIGIYIDNIDNYTLNMWVSLDTGIYLHITDENGNAIIKYLYERFPY